MLTDLLDVLNRDERMAKLNQRCLLAAQRRIARAREADRNPSWLERAAARYIIGAAAMLYARMGHPSGRWLAHYLLGDGSDMVITAADLESDLIAFTHRVLMHMMGSGDGVISFRSIDASMYYRVGAMTPEIDIYTGGIEITGVDVYDWINGASARMPFEIPGILALAFTLLFPKLARFVEFNSTDSYKMGTAEVIIGDDLWIALGGREFKTHVEIFVDFDALRESERGKFALRLAFRIAEARGGE